MRNIHDIGLDYGTDKANFHGYTRFYEAKLEHKRNEFLRILEIGICEGASIKMWHEYFPNSEIVGIDTNINVDELRNERMHMLRKDATKVDELLSIPGMFDIIIDDGSHFMLDQQVSLQTLFFEKLVPGGLYFLEDIYSSKPEVCHEFGGNVKNGTLYLLQDLKDGFIRPDSEYYINEFNFNRLLQTIGFIEFFNTGVLWKAVYAPGVETMMCLIVKRGGIK